MLITFRTRPISSHRKLYIGYTRVVVLRVKYEEAQIKTPISLLTLCIGRTHPTGVFYLQWISYAGYCVVLLKLACEDFTNLQMNVILSIYFVQGEPQRWWIYDVFFFLKCSLLKENLYVLFNCHWFVYGLQIDKLWALFQLMACCSIGTNYLPEHK